MIYIDGPVHDFPDRQLRDREKATMLDDMDYTVVRFHHQDDWSKVVARFPHVFGVGRTTSVSLESGDASRHPANTLDLDLFSDTWARIFSVLAQRGDLSIEAGSDVQMDGRVIGSYTATISKHGRTVYVVDASNDTHLQVSRYLQSENQVAIAIDPTDPDAIARILTSVGVL